MFSAVLLAVAAAYAQPASWAPAAPRAGDVVTIRYDARLGTLGAQAGAVWLHWGVLDVQAGNWSTPPVAIWPAGSHLHTDNVAVQSPMARGADSVWSITIDFDTTIDDAAFVFTDGQNHWDNNNGQDWAMHFAPPGTVSWWTPENAEPGDTLTIYYDAVAGTLPDNAGAVTLHWGVNESGHGNWHLPPSAIWPPGTVAVGVAAETPLQALGSGRFVLTIATTDSIRSLHYVFTNGTLWDNNNSRNWDILLVAPPVVQLTWHTFRFDPRSAFAGAVPGAIISVAVAGPFNGWSTTATPLAADSAGGYAADVRVPVGALEYKFVINGNQWQADPDNPRTMPGSSGNSLVLLAPDSLPQVFAIWPPENAVFTAESSVVVTALIRPGDVGPGIAGTPVARVNNALWSSAWNAADSTLTLAPLSNAPGTVARVTITVIDSAGRTGTREVSYGLGGRATLPWTRGMTLCMKAGRRRICSVPGARTGEWRLHRVCAGGGRCRPCHRYGGVSAGDFQRRGWLCGVAGFCRRGTVSRSVRGRGGNSTGGAGRGGLRCRTLQYDPSGSGSDAAGKRGGDVCHRRECDCCARGGGGSGRRAGVIPDGMVLRGGVVRSCAVASRVLPRSDGGGGGQRRIGRAGCV